MKEAKHLEAVADATTGRLGRPPIFEDPRTTRTCQRIPAKVWDDHLNSVTEVTQVTA